LARRANVLRILARLGTKQTRIGLEDEEIPKTSGAHLVNKDAGEALLFSPVRIAGDVRKRANEACRKLARSSVNQRQGFTASASPALHTFRLSAQSGPIPGCSVVERLLLTVRHGSRRRLIGAI
jgi:hypothetical protein